MKRLTSFSFLMLALAASAAALEIAGTYPKEMKGAASGNFDLSGIVVKDIAYDKGAVVLPVTENKGKTYIDVKLLAKTLYGKLETCFKSGCARPGKTAAPVIKVEALKPLKSKVRVANAEVSFDGELLVVLGVMASSKEPGTFWVAFPDAAEFQDENLRDLTEKAVKAAWAKEAPKKK